MSGIMGKDPNSFLLTGGGTNAPWNWGVSPFDLQAVDQATASNEKAVADRYNQLGLGGSTMERQDERGASQMGAAEVGQLQTQNVGNPALNPALQPEINQLIGTPGSSSSSSGLTQLAQQSQQSNQFGSGFQTGSA